MDAGEGSLPIVELEKRMFGIGNSGRNSRKAPIAVRRQRNGFAEDAPWLAESPAWLKRDTSAWLR